MQAFVTDDSKQLLPMSRDRATCGMGSVQVSPSAQACPSLQVYISNSFCTHVSNITLNIHLLPSMVSFQFVLLALNFEHPALKSKFLSPILALKRFTLALAYILTALL